MITLATNYLLTYIPYLFMFIQMMLASCVLCAKVEKRPYFWVRMASCLVAGGVGTYFMGWYDDWSIWGFTLVMAVTTLVMWICYDLNIIHSFIISVISYSLQNLSTTLASFITAAPMDWLSLAFLVVLIVIVYFVFSRNTNIKEVIGLRNIYSVIIALIALVSMIYLNANLRYDNAINIAKIFLIIADVLAVCLLFSISQTAQKEREKKDIEKLLKQEEALHKLSKENVELINMKCHDLKHYVNMMKAQGQDNEHIQEIENALRIYDSNVKTGNEDLDLVIAEKNMRCRENDIVMSCIIDGEAISFMSPGDIYALFSNALENAIEYLETVEDHEKRVIDFRIQRKEKFVVIKVENYLKQAYEVDKETGLPQTVKKDKDIHGFGLKSIRYIVTKYDGKLVVTQQNNRFSLNILLPLKKSYDMPDTVQEQAESMAAPAVTESALEITSEPGEEPESSPESKPSEENE